MVGGYILAETAKIYPFNNIYTHFPVDEKFENMGRLKEETERMEKIADICDENSIIFLNETFSSTNEELSIKISMEYIEKLCKKGVFGVFVTHQHNLIDLAEELNNKSYIKTKIDNLSTEIDIDSDNIRTYKIVRKKEMKSYAFDILKKYGLTKQQLENRKGVIIQ
jgi:DNA mismatch repair ATPase MutS